MTIDHATYFIHVRCGGALRLVRNGRQQPLILLFIIAMTLGFCSRASGDEPFYQAPPCVKIGSSGSNGPVAGRGSYLGCPALLHIPREKLRCVITIDRLDDRVVIKPFRIGAFALVVR